MAENIYLRLLSAAESGELAAVQWYSPHAADTGVGQGSLEEAATRTQGRRVVVLAPAADVLLLGADIPTQKRQRLVKAVPYALEERLAEDVDQLHFALGVRGDSAEIPVAVVARNRMDEWLEQLNEAGIQPQSMIPEQLLLPWDKDSWSLMPEASGVLLRTGPFRGYLLSGDNSAELLKLALEQAGEACPAMVQLFADVDNEVDIPELERLCNEAGIELKHMATAKPRLEQFAAVASKGAGIDLLQGDYSRREQLGKQLRPWRPAIVMLVVLLLLQGGMLIQHYLQLKKEEAQLSSRIEKLYRDTFPNARKVVNPRVQMERHLAELQGGGKAGGFIQLLDRAGKVLRGSPDLVIEALRYRQSELELELVVADFQALDRLKLGLIDGGMGVIITTAHAEQGKVRSQIRIQEAGA